MEYTENARLTVKTTAGGVLPVVGAVVRIRGADEENRFVEYSLLTDIDGLTPAILLPTPKREASLSPRAVEAPYSSYDVEIIKSGFYVLIFHNVLKLRCFPPHYFLLYLLP